MALPTSAQAKLNLSFNMAAKEMTVSVSTAVENMVLDNGLLFLIPVSGATLTDPTGATYDLTSLFSNDSSDNLLSLTFDAPLDSDNNVINGAYNILVGEILFDDGGSPPDTETFTDLASDYTLSYTAPTVALSAAINCISPSFVSTDYTDYRVIDPTSQGYITPTTVTYAHNLYYPATSNGYPSNATLTSDLIITRGASEFYQGTQTAIVTHLVSYLFVDNLVVTDTITGSLETLVDCSTLLCGVTCGLNTLYTTMEANKIANNTLYLQNKSLFELISSKAMLAQMNIDCGDSAMATTIIADIRATLGNCCDDCSAADGTPISGYGN